MTFRKSEELELEKLSKLTKTTSDSKKKEYSGVDLLHIIPFDTLIFYKPIYKSKGKETSRPFNEKEKKKIRAWDLGVNDAYYNKEPRTSDDLKIDDINEVTYILLFCK